MRSAKALRLANWAIGSAIEGAAVLAQPGILPLHCEIHITQTGANLQVPPGAGPVTVNGKPVTDLMALRSGDTLAIGPVIAKFTHPPAFRGGAVDTYDDGAGATRVRMALPKYMLRGLSGAVFSKIFPIAGPVVIGRAAECDISVPADEISRRHALIKPTLDGLSVEDLGSSNGTYINGKRVQKGFLNPGDELRLDAVRFIFVAPGLEGATKALSGAAPVAAKAAAASNKMQMWASILLTLAAIVVIGLLVLKK
jgi:pSer/pThr/pTyr-binding forkhead associated (FHA) protein